MSNVDLLRAVRRADYRLERQQARYGQGTPASFFLDLAGSGSKGRRPSLA